MGGTSEKETILRYKTGLNLYEDVLAISLDEDGNVSEDSLDNLGRGIIPVVFCLDKKKTIYFSGLKGISICRV